MSSKHRMRPEQRAVQLRFRDALLAFSDDPTPSNLARYLAASRALREVPRARTAPEAALAAATPMSFGVSAGHS